MTDPIPPAGRPPVGWTPAPLPGSFGPPAPGWAPPVPPPEPSGWPPPSGAGWQTQPTAAPVRRRTSIPVFAVVAVIVLLGSAVLAWTLLRPGPTEATTSTSPSVQPSAPVAVQGGGIGKAVALRGPDGTGTGTVTSATWTPDGEAPPVAGNSYLVVDVNLKGKSGELAVGGQFTVAIDAAGQRHGPAFGPKLKQPLASTRLQSGDTAAGQLGFQLPAGDVKIEFQDPDGNVLGRVAIPGP